MDSFMLLPHEVEAAVASLSQLKVVVERARSAVSRMRFHGVYDEVKDDVVQSLGASAAYLENLASMVHSFGSRSGGGRFDERTCGTLAAMEFDAAFGDDDDVTEGGAVGIINDDSYYAEEEVG